MIIGRSIGSIIITGWKHEVGGEWDGCISMRMESQEGVYLRRESRMFWDVLGESLALR